MWKCSDPDCGRFTFLDGTGHFYSIIFQFTSTQVIQMLHQRYKKHTLFIITKEPYQIYEEIFKLTNIRQHVSKVLDVIQMRRPV